MRKLLIGAALAAIASTAAAAPPVLNWGGNNTLPTPTMGIGSGTFTPAQVSVASTATQIVAARVGRNLVTVVNTSTTDVYLGGSGVTTSTGLLLPGTKGASLTLPYSGALYGIVATGTATVAEAETY